MFAKNSVCCLVRGGSLKDMVVVVLGAVVVVIVVVLVEMAVVVYVVDMAMIASRVAKVLSCSGTSSSSTSSS